MQSARGVYQRKGVWWVRVRANGRVVRRSTRQGDQTVAIAMRRELAEKLGRRIIDSEWARHVRDHIETSDSWLRRSIARARRKSVKRGWPSCISMNELAQLMLSTDGKCALTGLPFRRQVRPDGKPHPFAISLDRIENALGYELTNCRLVLLAVNLGMSHWGEAEFRAIARALVGQELLKGPYNSGTREMVSQQEGGACST